MHVWVCAHHRIESRRLNSSLRHNLRIIGIQLTCRAQYPAAPSQAADCRFVASPQIEGESLVGTNKHTKTLTVSAQHAYTRTISGASSFRTFHVLFPRAPILSPLPPHHIIPSSPFSPHPLLLYLRHMHTLLRRLQVYVSMFIFPLSPPSTLGEPV